MFDRVFLINTSHVDLTWWDYPDKCLDRIVNVIGEAMNLALSDDFFRFSIENTCSVFLFLSKRPENKETLMNLFKEGKIDIGGLYVAPVSDYSSDEAVFRNFIYGKKWLLDNLGIDTPLAREEDSPGHTLQFPQISQGFGMRFARFSRGPVGLFRWRSSDGSEILTNTSSYSWGFCHRLGKTTGEIISKGFPLRLRQAEEFNYPSGNLLLIDGDDNALPNKSIPKLVDAWNSKHVSPKFISATITDFFKSVENEQFNTYTGDIPNQWAQIAVFEPDVFNYIKHVQRNIRVAELCASLSSELSHEKEFDLIWRSLLECLDHNWGGRFQGAYGLVGDKIKLLKISTADSILSEITNEFLVNISERIPDRQNASKLIVFNTLSKATSGPVLIKTDANISHGSITVIDKDGREYDTQTLENNTSGNLIFSATDIPPSGYKTYYLIGEQSNNENKLKAIFKDDLSIENDFYRIRLNPNGCGIKSIYDKEINKELLTDNSGRLLDLFGIRFRFNEVWALGFRFDPAPEGFYDDPENEGKVGESVVITGEIKQAGEFISKSDRQPAKYVNGPVFSSITTSSSFLGGSTIGQEIIAYHSAKRIGLRTTIDWTGIENFLLCLSFPFGPADGIMRMDVPYGVHQFGTEVPGYWGKLSAPDSKIKFISSVLPNFIKRYLRTGFLEEKNAKLAKIKESLTKRMMKENESLSRGLYNWLDISNSQWGAALLAKHAPFDFTFGPNAILFASIKSSAFFNGEHYLRRGTQTFEYEITSHHGDCFDSNMPVYGRAANSPLIGFSIPAFSNSEAPLPSSASIINCDRPNIITTAVKPCEQKRDVLIRVYESAGRLTNACFSSSFSVKRAVLCDMMENEVMPLEVSENIFTVQIPPYKIINLKISL